ncbi:MAG TPA: hypothetical protein VK673_03395 [Chthoniobacterales bacterium]|nr:hypothetical protein [Chthoniobacterales bacterium]
MKKLMALSFLALVSQAAVSFAGPSESKEIVPTPAPPPESFFRGNEFDLGAFGTYFTGTGGNPGGTQVGQRAFDDTVDTFVTKVTGDTTLSGWGGGMDFTYYTPFKYLGFRFQGAGGSVSTGNFSVSESIFNSSGALVASGKRTGSFSTSVGVITADLVWRLPLDDFWSGVHLAPYAFSGLGAIFGGGTAQANTNFPELNQRFNNATNVKGRPLGHFGGGIEYRFTPHIGIFAEAGYDLIDHTNGRNGNNFVQTNFGLRFAF